MTAIQEHNLNPRDYVGLSFWLISIALAASCGFFTSCQCPCSADQTFPGGAAPSGLLFPVFCGI